MKKKKRRKKRRHVNKYKELVPERTLSYDPKDKTFRTLPVAGEPGQTLEKGLRVLFHGRVYALRQPITLPRSGSTIAPFKLIGYV